MTKDFKVLLIIPLLFFLASFLTLSHYGISWDEPIHFTRGQAYLNFFLTRNLDYSEFSGRHSLYQETSFNARFFLKNDSGHPPINGILAAFSNFVFYQKLGVLGDIESYHLFNILSATLLVFVVVVFARQAYGNIAAFFTGISLVVYPLFFAESHFNIKDPAEAAFFAATIWAFWNSLRGYKWKWLTFAAIFFALGLGTKFNILFLPLILTFWLVLRFGFDVLHPFRFVRILPRNYLLFLFVAPLIVAIIFFLSWPYLWQDPLRHTMNIFTYYKDIGTGGRGQLQFLTFLGFNLFPSAWIFFTTPPVILVLAALGLYEIFLRRKEQEKTAFLFLLWLIIPILRVSFPGSSIYGGVRQIMEFVPAIALISGLGANLLVCSLKSLPLFRHLSPVILASLILLFFLPHFLVMKKIHPNENVYFNFFIGGLQGAQKMNMPYWGNSFGNAYYQAILWLNKNAEPGSKLALVQGTMVNVPKIYLRPDINYSNSFWSGIGRGGEYLLELTHEGNEIAYPAVWEYINNVLVPVYEVKTDGIVIAKLWKNDIEHSKPEYQKEKELKIENIQKEGSVLQIEMDQPYALARININFNDLGECEVFQGGAVKTSVDGKNWRSESEKIGDEQVKSDLSLEKGIARYLFPGNKAKFIKIAAGSDNSCLFQNTKINLWGFKVREGTQK